MTNRERLNMLIRAVRDGMEYDDKPVYFDMTRYMERVYRFCRTDLNDGIYSYNACGTTCCVHGHAYMLFRTLLDEKVLSKGINNNLQEMANVLGVDPIAYNILCVPHQSVLPLIKRKHAVRALQHLRDTGSMRHDVWLAILDGKL